MGFGWSGIWTWIGLGLGLGLGLGWGFVGLGICLPGVIWIPPPPVFLNYGNGPPYIISLRFGLIFCFLLQTLAWVVVCGRLELN